jgi:hypothetical protein
VHGDVRSDNMSYDPETGRVVFFDFSGGLTRARFGSEAAFPAVCQDDLEALAEEAAWGAAHPERGAYYMTEQGRVVLPC